MVKYYWHVLFFFAVQNSQSWELETYLKPGWWNMPGSVQAWILGRGRRDGIYQVKQEQKVTRPRIENKCRSTNCYFKAKEKQATQAASIFKRHRSVAWGVRGDLCLLVLSAEDAVFPQRQRAIFEKEILQMQLQQATGARGCTWVNTCSQTQGKVCFGSHRGRAWLWS